MSFTGARILVVGGAGFVGSNLVRLLLAHKPQGILIVDNMLSADPVSCARSREKPSREKLRARLCSAMARAWARCHALMCRKSCMAARLPGSRAIASPFSRSVYRASDAFLTPDIAVYLTPAASLLASRTWTRSRRRDSSPVRRRSLQNVPLNRGTSLCASPS